MIIKRTLQARIEQKLFAGKIIILYGSRQVGKTTLCREIMKNYGGQASYFSCDEPNVRDAFSDKTSGELKRFIGDKKLVVIDEAQRVKNIGITLKLLVDNYPATQIIATGSSSFDLSNKTNEPLTGRNYEFRLHPFSLEELSAGNTSLDLTRFLNEGMIYGFYPEIIVNSADRAERLQKLATDYLYRDALMYQDVRKPDSLEKLLRLLALQIGNEVSMRELAGELELSKETVEWYIRLLEQAFIIFRLPPLGRNRRKEVTRLQKIYFNDIGIRNALIQNFNSLDLRNDIGQMFENLAIMEVKKRIENHGKMKKMYFWRTKSQAEVDLVVEDAQNLSGFECKWKKETFYPPTAWKSEFPQAAFESITKETLNQILESI